MGSSVTITSRNEHSRVTMKSVLGIFAAILATSYAAHPAPYHPAPYHPAPYHPAPYHPAPPVYKPAPVPAYKPAPAPAYKPAPDYADEPVYRCPNYPYYDEAPHALSHLQYEIDALRQRAALVNAHGAAVLASQQEPNKPFVGGVYY